MKLIPCKKSDLKKEPKANIFRLIKEFTNSGAECALVQGGAEHYATPNVGVRAINSAFKRYKVYGAKARNIDGQIYLIKE